MPTPAVRNNNPGNLKDPKTGQFRQFASPQEGYNALKQDLQVKLSGASSTGIKPNSSIRQFASVWAPASDKNDPEGYSQKLSQQLGVTPDTPISALHGREDDFAHAIAQNEDAEMAKILKGTIGIGGQNAPSKQRLSREQLVANIDAMEKQGASQQEVQGYLDSLKNDATPQQSGVGGNYPAPPEVKPFVPADTKPESNSNINPTAEVAKGGLKGLIGGVTGIGDIGNQIANQTVGRVANLVTGRGFTANQDSAGALESGAPAEENLKKNLEAENAYQTAGKIGETALELAVPFLAGKRAYEAASLPGKVLKAVSPRLTTEAAVEATKTAPQGVRGLISTVPTKRTEAMANVAKNIFNPKKTFSENSTNVESTIVNKAQELANKPELERPYIFRELQSDFKKMELPHFIKTSEATVQRRAKSIINKFMEIAKENEGKLNGLLKSRKEFDVWMKKEYKNVFDKEGDAVSDLTRKIRDTVHTFIEKRAPEAEIKKSLKEQNLLYDVKDVFDRKAVLGELQKAGEIGSTRLSRFWERYPNLIGASKTLGKAGLIAGLTTVGAGGLIKLMGK